MSLPEKLKRWDRESGVRIGLALIGAVLGCAAGYLLGWRTATLWGYGLAILPIGGAAAGAILMVWFQASIYERQSRED